jgi:predicted glycosyltransferase
MKILIELNHPKHYYQFKYVMRILEDNGHSLKVVARNKDILLSLLDEECVEYEIFGVHRKSIAAKVLATFSVVLTYLKIFDRFKPDVVISKASFYSSFIARIKGVRSIIFPDSEVVTVTNRIVVPLASKVVTPETFELNFGSKHIKVPGLFENCYLHPDILKNIELDKSLLSLKYPYAIVRFIGWTANHDTGKSGFSTVDKIKIVEKIAEKFTVYISSEATLPKELVPFELKTPKSAIHAVLQGASLYVGDSQTMATEAALLGTPAIRSNSFVGENDMSNFKILEHKYDLLRNVLQNNNVLKVIEELSVEGTKEMWMKKKDSYFRTVGNTNQIIANIILK